MKKAVIISGGKIQSDFALDFLKVHPCDFMIGADKGIMFCKEYGIIPTHIVGDFDSAKEEALEWFLRRGGVSVRRFDPVKDFTDTDIAMRLALELGASCIYIIGGTGTRLDHVAANIRILSYALEKGVRAYLLDANNRIWLTDRSVVLKKSEQFGRYISLFAMGGTVSGLTLEGFFYPLSGYALGGLDPLCVSNEITGSECRISFSEGILMVMESKD